MLQLRGVIRCGGVLGLGGLGLMTSSSVVFAKDVVSPEESSKPKEWAIYDDLRRNRLNRLPIERVEPVTELERGIAQVRGQIVPLKNSISQTTQELVSTAKDSANSVIDGVRYLRTSAPPEVKIGSIVGSGVVGMLLGLRRGLFKKLFYGVMGAGAAAAVIYPGDAKVVANCTAAMAKNYSVIVYHFIVGPQQPTKKAGEEKVKE